MNRHERYMWNECRSITLPALIARLVEAYECNPERCVAVMRFKYLPGRHPGAKNPVNEAVAGALNQSQSQATRETFGRTLHDGSSHRQRFSELLDSWHRGNSDLLEERLTDDLASGDFTWMRTLAEKERFDESPDKIERLMESPQTAKYLLEESEKEKLRHQEEAGLMDRFPAFKEEWAERFRVDSATPSDEFVRLCRLALVKQMEEADIDSLRAPSSTVSWAKELVGRLPEIIEREDEIATHSIAAIGEQIPIAHRTLFEQAHMLYLFDFDIPCILTCGTLAEELVEKEFPDLSEKWAQKGLPYRERKIISWRAKVSDVVLQNPRYCPAEGLLLDIMKVRNQVAHDPASYLNAGGKNSEEILRQTRNVLEIFFDVAKSQVEEV